MKRKGALAGNIIDLDSREKSAARIYLRSKDGNACLPKEYLGNVGGGYFWVDGDFKVKLRPGEYELIASHGFSYGIFERKVVVEPGKVARVEIGLKRWMDEHQMGWYSGDMHMHLTHGGPGYNPFRRVGLEDGGLLIKAEDINLGNFLSGISSGPDSQFYQKRGVIYWKARPPLTVDRNHIVNLDPEFAGASYGHLCPLGLNSEKPPSYWYSVHPGAVHVAITNRILNHSPGWPPNRLIYDYIHKEGGVVSIAHPITGRNFWPGGDSGCPQHLMSRAIPLDITSGKVDAFDAVFSYGDLKSNLEVYYKILNCGFRLAFTAGTDGSLDSGQSSFGMYKFYAYIGPDKKFSLKNFVEGIRRKRTFVTNGPLIFLKVNQAGIGDCLRLNGRNRPVQVAVAVKYRALSNPEKVTILRNGRAVRTFRLNRNKDAAGWQKSFKLKIDRSCWLAARCDGRGLDKRIAPEKTFAHTSPIYIEFGRQPVQSEKDAIFFLRWLDNLREEVEARTNWKDPSYRAVMLREIRKARGVFLKQIPGGRLKDLFKVRIKSAANMIKNAGFESTTDEKLPRAWEFVAENKSPARGRVVACDDKDTKGLEVTLYRDSIRGKGYSPGDKAYFKTGRITLRPDVTYEMGAKIKMSSRRNVGHHGFSCAYLSVADEKGNEIARSNTIDQAGETPWLEVKGRFISDKKPVRVSFCCVLERVAGKAVFKDLYLRETEKTTVRF